MQINTTYDLQQIVNYNQRVCRIIGISATGLPGNQTVTYTIIDLLTNAVIQPVTDNELSA